MHMDTHMCAHTKTNYAAEIFRGQQTRVFSSKWGRIWAVSDPQSCSGFWVKDKML